MNTLSCAIEDPHFSWLVSGEKTVIAKVRKGKWDNLFVGDTLLITRGLNGTQVEFQIASLIPAIGFEELYSICGSKLLPSLPDKAWHYYQQHFSREEEMSYGVIGIEVSRKIYF